MEQPAQQPPQPPHPPAITQETKVWALATHLSALLVCVLPIPIVGSIVIPLVIWLIKKDESPFLDQHGRESLNFQISCWIYAVIIFIVCFILSFIVIGIFLFFILPPALIIFWIVCIIMASVKAYNGEMFIYPATIRFL
jgi:uncharacterized Tic20 family protein